MNDINPIAFITKDMQIIQPGVEIYYTGDMANSPDVRIVEKIEFDQWWGKKITLKSVESGEISELGLSNFEPGPGRRFLTMEKYQADRSATLDRLAKTYLGGVQ